MAYIACAVGKINGGALDDAEGTFSGATSAPVNVATGGDPSTAFQVSATKTFSSQNGQTTTQYTFVFANRGRVAYEIFVRGSGAAMDPEELADYVQSAASHIQQHDDIDHDEQKRHPDRAGVTTLVRRGVARSLFSQPTTPGELDGG